MKAVIIATGQAPRLLPLTKHTPTCLLSIGDKPILAHQIERLQAAGVADILVIAGPHLEQVEMFGHEQEIEVYYNPFYLYSHVTLSLWIIQHKLTESFLLLYADVLFGTGVIEGLLAQTSKVGLAVARESVDAEAEKVLVKDGLVYGIGKVSLVPKQAYGEFIGVAYFDETTLPALRSALEHLARVNVQAPFTHLIQNLIERGTQIMAYDIKDVPWIDIDFPQDVETAVNLFG